MFIGTTRNNFNGKTVIRLEYEAYIPMARREMGKICESIRQQWPSVEHIAMYHRLGRLSVKFSAYLLWSIITFRYQIMTLNIGISVVYWCGHDLLCSCLGLVPISEASVIIAVSSPHRVEALQATAYAIDTLKANVGSNAKYTKELLNNICTFYENQ